jgi:hypothetical protein
MDKEQIELCIEQIKYKRFRNGIYSGLDPYVAVKEKLYKMRQDPDIALNETELLLLLQATKESIQYIRQREHLPETLEKVQGLEKYLRVTVMEMRQCQAG